VTCALKLWHTGAVISAIPDTHRLVTILKKHGFTDQQAEGVAAALQELDLSQLSTKADLRELELRMVIKLGTLIVAGVTFLTFIKFFG